MWHGIGLAAAFFEALVCIDEQIARRVAEDDCPRCGGPLHRSDYDRKPRGGVIAVVGAAFARRFSLCCGHCRKRAMPPSVRFLGRRVYVEVVVVLASALARLAGDGARHATGVPARTIRRWGTWWTSSFPALAVFADVRAQFPPPPPDERLLPLSLLERLPGRDPDAVLILAARWLAPVTTTSLPDSARFAWVT